MNRLLQWLIAPALRASLLKDIGDWAYEAQKRFIRREQDRRAREQWERERPQREALAARIRAEEQALELKRRATIAQMASEREAHLRRQYAAAPPAPAPKPRSAHTQARAYRSPPPPAPAPVDDGMSDLISAGIGYAIGRALSDDDDRCRAPAPPPFSSGGGGDYGGGGASGSWDSGSDSSSSSSSDSGSSSND